MSETWTMPTWMREILLAINPNMNEPEWARVVNLDSEPNTYRDEDPYLAETMAETELLESLRAAELLFTPGENDMHARAYDQACRDITRLRAAGLPQTPGEKDSVILDMGEMITVSVLKTRCAILEGMYARLRAENADLLENYKRADRGLRECCDSKERIRTENKKMQGFIEIVASCAGWQKDEGGNYMESNGVCPNCQDEARKILKALGGDHD